MTFHATRNREDGTVTVHWHHQDAHLALTEPHAHVMQFWHELGKQVIEDNEDRAKAGYGRYREVFNRVAAFGEMKPWAEISPEHQECWIAAFTE